MSAKEKAGKLPPKNKVRTPRKLKKSLQAKASKLEAKKTVTL